MVESLRARRTLEDAGQPIDSVFFPLTAVVAVMAVADKESLEIATVGNEGVVGLPAVLGSDRSAMRTVVREQGTAIRVPLASLRDLMEQDAMLRRMLRRFTLALMTQLGQSVVCNRVHRISSCYGIMRAEYDRVLRPDGAGPVDGVA